MKRTFPDEPLKDYTIPSFKKGYNSYSQSKSNIDKEEIPIGQNVWLDDNGSAAKRSGSSRFSDQVSAGNPVTSMEQFITNSVNTIISASGTAWQSVSSTGVVAALTGTALSANLDTDFCQAVDRLYGANGTDPLTYTSNATTITQVTVSGNVGRWPVYYNNRIYMTNTTFKDRIYYSNPINVDYSTSPPALSTTDFGTFNTDLTVTPKKNAGYIILIPGGGVEIMALKKDVQQGTESIYAYTKMHGIWQLSFSSLDSSGAVVHTIRQIVPNYGTPSGRSIVKVINDQEFFGYDNFYSLGEVSNYQNLRISTKSARIRSEVRSISPASFSSVACHFNKEKLFTTWATGSFNNRMIARDTRLNAYSTPLIGLNGRCFLSYVDGSGNLRLLYGSADPSDSYIYEIDDSLSDNGVAIEAFFETKSTDCESPGLVKRFAFIDVFYGYVFGTLTYQVFINETEAATGQLQLGASSNYPTGFASLGFGRFAFGRDTLASGTTIQYNDKFRIPCTFKKGDRVSVRFTNNNINEQFKINGLKIYYLPGSIFET